MLSEDSKVESNDYKNVSSVQQNQPMSQKVGNSQFFVANSCMVASEKQDIMKPEDYIDEGIRFPLYLPSKC